MFNMLFSLHQTRNAVSSSRLSLRDAGSQQDGGRGPHLQPSQKTRALGTRQEVEGQHPVPAAYSGIQRLGAAPNFLAIVTIIE